MKLTSNSNDQYILVAVASAFAYLAWVIYNPTMNQCNTLHKFFPIGRVLIYWGWLLYACFKRKPTPNWSWSQFGIGAFFGGFCFVFIWIMCKLIWNFPDGDILRKIQPIVEVTPYAVVSGLVAAFEKDSKKVISSAFIIFFLQLLMDVIVWLPWICAY